MWIKNNKYPLLHWYCSLSHRYYPSDKTQQKYYFIVSKLFCEAAVRTLTACYSCIGCSTGTNTYEECC